MRNAQIFRDQHINAVRFPVNMRVDPLQFDLQLFGIERRCPQHAKATRLAHRCHNIAAVAEREQRKFDAEFGA